MNNKARRLMRIATGLVLLATAVVAQAQLSIEPITWDVVGLDSNRPTTEGPNLFPVGAEVCSATATSNLQVEMVWDDPDDSWIFSRPGSLTSLTFDEMAPGECIDAYFEIEVARSAGAFEQFRPYRIIASDGSTTVETPDTRAIYVERLVSQNRNTTSLIRWGRAADQSDWQVLGEGGGLNLEVAETYFIELTTDTSTAYEQLQSFLTLSNTIFQVKSVSTTYSDVTAPSSRVPDPNPRLWADGCLWESDFDSPNWLSCLSDGKAGGTVVTTYEIDIVSGGGDSVALIALIYDQSGSSFHYNTDFSQSPGEINIIDPEAAGFAKRFLPETISVGNTSRLLFTISNPNPVDLAGYTFVDNLPMDLEVAAIPDATSTCGGLWNPLAGETSLTFDIGSDVIAANSTCSIGVDIAAPGGTGTYDNVSENLFFEDADTGLSATASLVVDDAPPPPACVPEKIHSEWLMDGETAPPAPSFVYSGNTADATAAFSAAAGGIDSIVANPAGAGTDEAWAGTGWSTSLEPDGPGPDVPSYFEFVLDSAAFATNPAEPMSISLDALFETPQDWANNQNITLNIWASRDGGQFENILNQNDINKNQVNPLSATFTPGAGSTRIRINASGISPNQGAEAQLLLDNVRFAGCGPADPADLLDPPMLDKDFSPDPIGAGQVSTLTFSVTNPNPTTGDDLTGIEFSDLLPPDVVVAPTPNAATTCGGAWAPAAGDSQLNFTDGSLVADSSCTVSVDVTSDALGTHVNISDFIYANESGQNDTSAGQASDTLTVLAPPEIDKVFDPGLLLVGSNGPDVSWLEFTITNPNPLDSILDVAFEDEFPAGLVVAEPATGPAELSVVKQLDGQSADPIVPGTTLTYIITATNNDSAALTGVTVTDSLVAVNSADDCSWPSAQDQLLVDESVSCTIDYIVTQADLDAGKVVNTAVATSNETGADEARYRLLTPLAENGCGMAAWAPVTGAGSVSLSGASVAPGGRCSVGVWVSGPAGIYDNLSEPVSHVIGGATVEGNSAAATLVIDEPIPAVSVEKQVGLTDDTTGTKMICINGFRRINQHF
ncbi:MAG: hypothetical protein R6V61_10035 [Wenzhouxiangellaceae bacterium]